MSICLKYTAKKKYKEITSILKISNNSTLKMLTWYNMIIIKEIEWFLFYKKQLKLG